MISKEHCFDTFSRFWKEVLITSAFEICNQGRPTRSVLPQGTPAEEDSNPPTDIRFAQKSTEKEIRVCVFFKTFILF